MGHLLCAISEQRFIRIILCTRLSKLIWGGYYFISILQIGKLRHGAAARTRSRLLNGALRYHVPLLSEPQDCCSLQPLEQGREVGIAGRQEMQRETVDKEGR